MTTIQLAAQPSPPALDLGERGTRNRGIESRGLEYRQAGPGAGQPRSGTASSPSKSFVHRTIEKQRERELLAAQRDASKIFDSLLPYFDRAFAPFAKTNKKIGTRPQFRVLDSQSFTQNLEARDKIFRDEFISLYIKLRYQHVQEKLNAITMRGSVSGSYPSPIGPTTKLHPRDANIIWPPATKSKPGAFYDPFTNSLNVRIDQVDPGIIAHECCHYFTAKKWDESILLLAVYDLDPTAVHIDEGVTSAVANTVLYEWNKSARPAHAPDGFAGYGSDVRRVAQKFVTHADGTLFTPGKNALGAYLGGAVSVTISKRDHWSSRLTVGTASFLMSAVR